LSLAANIAKGDFYPFWIGAASENLGKLGSFFRLRCSRFGLREDQKSINWQKNRQFHFDCGRIFNEINVVKAEAELKKIEFVREEGYAREVQNRVKIAAQAAVKGKKKSGG
jgi:hypothetical protein